MFCVYNSVSFNDVHAHSCGCAMALKSGKVLCLSWIKNGNLQAGNVSEKVPVDINGMENGMFIEGKDATNPVLLFVALLLLL